MKIVIDGKQVWPTPNRVGMHRYKFNKEADGRLVYTETSLDARGYPDKKNPVVIVEMNQDESEYLAITLSKFKSSGNSLTRTELEGALQRLNEINKDAEPSETK